MVSSEHRTYIQQRIRTYPQLIHKLSSILLFNFAQLGLSFSEELAVGQFRVMYASRLQRLMGRERQSPLAAQLPQSSLPVG